MNSETLKTGETDIWVLLYCILAGMEYTIKRVKSRSIKVRVEPEGRVVVTASKWVPKIIIDGFVKQHNEWIEKQLKRTKLKSDLYPTMDWEKKIVSYMGKLYTIRIKKQEARITINEQEISISPVTGLEADAKKMLVSWLKREAENYIIQKLPFWAEKMGLGFSQVSFRQQKSRWGSCATNGNLSFNWRLIHFKPEIIDYVLIHELAHLKHHDHSVNFWALVAKYDPTYKIKRDFLHKQVVSRL